jgi:HEAT repeat protein
MPRCVDMVSAWRVAVPCGSHPRKRTDRRSPRILIIVTAIGFLALGLPSFRQTGASEQTDIKTLLALLKSPDPGQELSAARSLVNLHPQDPVVVQALGELLRTSADDDARTAATNALIQIGPPIATQAAPALIDVVLDERAGEAVSSLAGWTLGNLKAPASQVLINALGGRTNNRASWQ